MIICINTCIYINLGWVTRRVTWRIVGATGVMIVAVGLMIQFLG